MRDTAKAEHVAFAFDVPTPEGMDVESVLIQACDYLLGGVRLSWGWVGGLLNYIYRVVLVGSVLF